MRLNRSNQLYNMFNENGATDGNRTRMVLPPQDFKSCAYASSATGAYMVRSPGIEPGTC